jgi:hypothetical protein
LVDRGQIAEKCGCHGLACLPQSKIIRDDRATLCGANSDRSGYSKKSDKPAHFQSSSKSPKMKLI